MTIQRPVMTDGEHRVVKFRPRTLARPPAATAKDDTDNVAKADPAKVARDLSQYERGRESPEEYRHRMIANVAAIVFTAALTGIGIWLAMTLADLRNTQDCVLMGRRDCAHISAQNTHLARYN
jgi:hypothetical protein